MRTITSPLRHLRRRTRSGLTALVAAAVVVAGATLPAAPATATEISYGDATELTGLLGTGNVNFIPGAADCGADGGVVTSVAGVRTMPVSDGSWLDAVTLGCAAVEATGSQVGLRFLDVSPGYGVARGGQLEISACPEGSVAVGLQGRQGQFVDQIRLWCAQVGVDGRLGAPAAAADATGGDGGSAVPAQFCPPGAVVVSARGTHGQSLNTFIPTCRPLVVTDTALRFSGIGNGRVEVDVFEDTESIPTDWIGLSADVRWGGGEGIQGIVSQPANDDAVDLTLDGWALYLDNGRPCMSATATVFGDEGPTPVLRRLCAGEALPVGTWVHVEGGYGGNFTTVSVDGDLVAQEVWEDGATRTINFAFAYPLLVGTMFATDPATAFVGDLDNIGVENTNEGGGPYLRLPLDEGSGLTVSSVVPRAAGDGTPTGELTASTESGIPQWVDHFPPSDEPTNTTWPTALTLTPGEPVDGAVLRPGEARWYKIPVTPDARVTVDVTNLPADYGVTLFKDIGQAFTDLTTPSDVTRLSAEFAADAFAPSVFSPSVFSPSVFSPSVFSPSVFSPSVFSPSVFSPSVFSPSVFSPSVFSPSVFSPSVFSPSVFSPSVFSPSVFSPSVFSPSVFSPETFADAWSSAQTRSIVAVSYRDGLADEQVSSATWDNTGFFYVRVVGRGGAFSPTPYSVVGNLVGGACPVALDPETDLASLQGTPGSATTVILTDTSRFGTADLTTMNARLADLAAQTGGVVVDLKDSPRIAALNAQADSPDLIGCPYAKNLVAQAARDVVNSFRGADPDTDPLTYVVLVGGDSVVPFFRYPDAAGLGPESGYVPPVADRTASQASLRRNTFLSQDAYGAQFDLSLKGTELPVPDLAVGRLVETPAEISSTIAGYLAAPVLTPSSSLVTGYDFLTDAADAVAKTLDDGIPAGTRDRLITDQDVPPATTTVGGTPSRRTSWTADDLRAQLLAKRHDITYLAGHFSANSALAADYTTSVVTTELASAPAGTFTNTLVLSAGCHSGYNLLDADGVPGLTLGLDWAQAFAQQGATLVAGTGYQYGDTDFLEYSERLYAGLLEQLQTGDADATNDDAAVPLGVALTAAKQRYLEETPSMRGIHQKALLEATLFGLPMKGVDLPSRATAPAAPAPLAVVDAPTGTPGAVLGLETAQTTLAPPTAEVTKELTLTTDATTSVLASYLRGPDGVVTNPAEPTLPLDVIDATVPGQVLRGIGWRGGRYTDRNGVVPLTGAPATELSAPHTPFASSAFYPSRLATPNYFGALSDGGSGRTTIAVTPAQYRSTAPGSTTATERSYDSLDLELFYNANTQTYGTNTPALAAPPSIVSVDAPASPGASGIPVSVHVVGDPSAGIQKVWILYTGTSGSSFHGTWVPVDLVQDATDSTLWTGVVPTPADGATGDVRFLVQAVNGVGLVSADDNGGEYYTPGATAPVTAQNAPPAPTLTLGAAPGPVAVGGTATVTATLADGAAGVDGKPVLFTLGTSSGLGVTNADGVATARIVVPDAPGDLTLQASFEGDRAFGAASSGTATVTVTKRPAALALAPASTTVAPGADTGVVATLTSGSEKVPDKTVTFTVRAAGDVVAGFTRKTGADGTAELGSTALPSGTYTVTARFGTVVTLPNGTEADLADASYEGATSPTVDLAVGTPPGITGTPPGGTVGVGYSFAFAVTGTAPVTVGLSAGTLPPGLTLSGAGVLAGTPTAAGTYDVTVKASSPFGNDAFLSVRLVVEPSPAPVAAAVTVVSGNAQTGVAGLPFDAPLVVRVVDAGGVPVPGQPVVFRVTGGSARFAGAATATVTTGADGVATSPVLTAGTATGAVTVTATAGGAPAATFTGQVIPVRTARADLVAGVSAPTPVARNQTFTVRVTVRNAGPNTAGATLTAFTPGAGLTVVSAPGATRSGSVWTWSERSVAVGRTVTYEVTLRASATRATTTGVAVATVSVVADPRGGNNAASAGIRIT